MVTLVHTLALCTIAVTLANPILYAGDHSRFMNGRRYDGYMYFAIAASPPDASAYARAFNKTVTNITSSSFGQHNVTLDTLLIDLPENGSFSAALLERLCRQFEGKHVVAVFIIGDGPAAFTVSQAAQYAGVPVLWARGFMGVGRSLSFEEMGTNPLETHLTPHTFSSLLLALRYLLLYTHWHKFTILAADQAAANALQRPDLYHLIASTPLHPTLISLPHQQPTDKAKVEQVVFRKLADVSRLTRGVVVLLSDRWTAVKVLEYGRRLNMLDGEFIWVWLDTKCCGEVNTSEADAGKKGEWNSETGGSSSESTNDSDVPPSHPSNAMEQQRSTRSVRDELDDMQVNYLLKNDQFLLFNHRNNDNNRYDNSGFPSTLKDIDYDYNSQVGRTGRSVTPQSTTLPTGLLALRPVPLKVDRHLVKAAVKLLVTTLRVVLSSSNQQDIIYISQSTVGTRVDTGRISSSCWRPLSERASNFSRIFARELKKICTDALAGKKFSQENSVDKLDKSLVANFEILNLIPQQHHTSKEVDNNNTLHSNLENESTSSPVVERSLRWKRVGMVSGQQVRLDTIMWPGGDLSVSAVSSRARSVFRIVTALAPPFVMESDLDEDGQCLRGLRCHRVLTSDKDNLTLVFNEMEYKHRIEEELEESEPNLSKSSSGEHLTDNKNDHQSSNFKINDNILNSLHDKLKYKTHCCYGLSMDLLENIAAELEFDFRLYIVADGLFGTRKVNQETQRKRRALGKTFISYRFSRDNYNRDKSSDSLFVRDNNQDEFDQDEIQGVKYKWNGIVGDLISGAAHMSFAPLSVSSVRSSVIDFSVPYFYSGVSFLAAPQQKSEIPLMAFLLPFSPELWIAIFTSLNITAIAVAIYEWLSPFGLNPWGRQRSKNFSMSSALWVMWGLLCGHLVAFKAPKSWPNKFLINVWGGFSVIFVASYTANIAALIAGLFFQNTVSNYHDRSLLSQKVGAPRASAAEYYVQKANRLLWEHMHKYSLENVEDGIHRLRNGSLDILIADTPILDYYRATDHGCKLHKIGDTINEDTFAIGMNKGFPLKDSISAVIAKYSSNGYMDILQEKWYGGLPCFKLPMEIGQPRPLGVAAVTGVFILLGVGMFVGCLILFVEHVFFRYSLPALREKPKDSVWRSRNIMFFSQKLYRFINCVELVSPHHAARELVHTIRQGQITSLFQKSIKRVCTSIYFSFEEYHLIASLFQKEHEQRRRRKSKAQFFEMIQEIRRQQQEERTEPQLESVAEDEAENQFTPENDNRSKLSPSIIRRTFMRSSPKSDNSGDKKFPGSPSVGKILFSPLYATNNKDQRSPTNLLNVRRFSTDSIFKQPLASTLKVVDRSAAVGRRLSKDVTSFLSSSPPDINSRRSSYLDIISSSGKLSSGKSPVLSIENISVIGLMAHERKLSDSESIGRKLATLPKRMEPVIVEKSKLTPQYSLQLRKSDETISNKTALHDNDRERKISASAENLLTQGKPEKSKKSAKAPIHHKTLLMKSKTIANNPHIRIEIEDTSLSSKGSFRGRRRSLTESPSVDRFETKESQKIRQHSLVETTLSALSDPSAKRNSTVPVVEQSKSLDRDESTLQCKEHGYGIKLPPAPPAPNCSLRNMNFAGKSPLERLSRDELMLLWRSSESELRSHLLKAIREKEPLAVTVVTEKPP